MHSNSETIEVTISELLQRAAKLEKNGHLSQAEQIYRQMLAQIPDNPDICYGLANVLYNAGQYTKEVETLSCKAIDLQPDHDAAYNFLGLF